MHAVLNYATTFRRLKENWLATGVARFVRMAWWRDIEVLEPSNIFVVAVREQVSHKSTTLCDSRDSDSPPLYRERRVLQERSAEYSLIRVPRGTPQYSGTTASFSKVTCRPWLPCEGAVEIQGHTDLAMAGSNFRIPRRRKFFCSRSFLLDLDIDLVEQACDSHQATRFVLAVLILIF